jgi:hypothetical protein
MTDYEVYNGKLLQLGLEIMQLLNSNALCFSFANLSLC